MIRTSLGFINSIKKYFKLTTEHPSDEYVDFILENGKYKNVVVLLLDGFGVYNMNLCLKKNSFLQQKYLTTLQTCFPPTTVAATGMIETGLTPGENNRLGWEMYSPTSKKKFITFNYFDDNLSQVELLPDEKQALNLKRFYHKFDNAIGLSVSKFGDVVVDSFEEQTLKIKELCEKNNKFGDTKMYLYAYCTEPDSTMHRYGVKSMLTKKVVRNLNSLIKKNLTNIEDTIIFITADHGHIDAEWVYLPDYPDIFSLIEGEPCIEVARCSSVKVKDGKQEEFKEKFIKTFSPYFSIYSHDEVFEKNLFENLKPISFGAKSIFDFVIVSNTEKCLAFDKEIMEKFKGVHAGNTKHELEVPLIVIDNKSNN